MIIPISLGLSCVAHSQADIDEALASGIPDIYVPKGNGKFTLRRTFNHGGFIALEVDKLPKEIEGVVHPVAIKEEIQFIPEGRVPGLILLQIVQFFKDVMKKFSDDEAMVHVVWSKENGYKIKVPKQRVSKASISFESDHLEPGETVVLDIHSHNSMGEHYSYSC